jgi:hypothetical protein
LIIITRTTPGRDPDDELRSVWTGKGQHHSTVHSDHSDKCGKAWYKQVVKTTYPACDLISMREITVNELGQGVCHECGCIAEYDHNGRIYCNCTVWNEGVPRPRRAPDPKPEAVRMRQWRKFGKNTPVSLGNG